MNVIICDDELECRDAIAEAVTAWAERNNHSNAVMIRAFSSSEDLLDAWEKGLSIDMLFLDIQIPNEMDGMNIAKAIFQRDEQIPIAFVTNYSEYACEGYLVNALRYILKPVQQQAIDDCMRIAWNHWQLAQTESIRIETGKQVMLVPARNILCIESFKHDLIITTTSNETLTVRGPISRYENLLPAGLFGQCHKSHIVNIMYVRKLDKGAATLIDGKTIPIGRKYASDFLQLFNQYNQGR